MSSNIQEKVGVSPVDPIIRNPPAVVKDPREEDMTTHSSILAWRVPWTEEPGGLQSTESQRIRQD